MNQTLQHVEYLLQRHDCVIIPGLGAILGHGSSAHYDEKLQMWTPPTRVLSFNPELSRTDGLLASSIARRYGITFDAASTQVKAAVDQMRRSFESEGSLQLGKVGRLTLTQHGTMAFETADTSWLSPQTLWLPQVTAKRIATASQFAHNHELNERRNWRLNIAMRRAGQIAASIAVIMLLGFLVKTGINDIRHDQFASFAPIKAETKVDAPTPAPVAKVVEPVAVAEIIDTVADIVEEPKQAPVQSIRFNEDDKFLLIIASLANQAEADKFLSQQKGIQLGVLNVDGRHRVYAATGRTYAEAYNATENPEIQNRYPSSWVCRK